MSALIDLIGQRFGRLVVTGRSPGNAEGAARWDCLCDCGTVKAVRGTHLRRGLIRSCGCLQRENALKKKSKGRRSHTPEYRAWKGMNSRCSDPQRMSYKHYGGRGIRVEFTSFEEFLAEVGPRPPGTSIDRIDNDGNYAPGNVRWATPIEQAANKRAIRRGRGLKAEEIRAIRASFSETRRKCADELAGIYGVSSDYVYKVMMRYVQKDIS